MQQTLFNSLQFKSPYEHTSSALKIVKLDIILCISGGCENTELLAWNSEWTNKQFSCDICFKEFTNKKSLRIREISTKEEPNAQCVRKSLLFIL